MLVIWDRADHVGPAWWRDQNDEELHKFRNNTDVKQVVNDVLARHFTDVPSYLAIFPESQEGLVLNINKFHGLHNVQKLFRRAGLGGINRIQSFLQEAADGADLLTAAGGVRSELQPSVLQ